jgi:putative addiction module component (TIGR02574 family)
MKAASIRLKLYDYIRIAEDKKVKAIYTMLEEEIEETFDHWKDKEFVEELEKRSADYKDGKVKGVSWEDAKAQILSSAKRKK